MARTQIDGDLIRDKSIGVDDLTDAVNIYSSKAPKIFKLSGFYKNHTQIDYTLLNLYPKRYILKGEIYKVEWYADSELTNLVLLVDITYYRDAAGFAISRQTRRRWVNNDDTFNTVEKITNKEYSINHNEMIKEGKKRRELLVDNLQIPVMQAMMSILLPNSWTEEDVILRGRQFLDEYDVEFSKFIHNSSTVNKKSDPNYGKKTVVVKLENETNTEYTSWLDEPCSLLSGASIRQYLINEFSI